MAESIKPQDVADTLVHYLPRRTNIFSVEITWSQAARPACAVRARVGKSQVQEIVGLGDDPASAAADLYNRACEVSDG